MVKIDGLYSGLVVMIARLVRVGNRPRAFPLVNHHGPVGKPRVFKQLDLP